MADKPKLKIRVVTEVEVDRDAWNNEYFSDDSAATIRDEIKYRANESVKEHFKHLTHAVTVLD